jgi:hypothetical protein
MIKEFFLIDYGDINSLKSMVMPLTDLAVNSFLLIAAIFELLKGFVGKSNPETRVTYFILATFSILVFNNYNQQVMNISFETADKILSLSKVTSMTSLVDVAKTGPSEVLDNLPNKQNKQKVEGKNPIINQTPYILGDAKTFIANNLAVALAWLASVLAIGLSRFIFSVVYYAMIVLSPVIIFISVFPGFESSLKAFWQTFLWCFLAPIVFAVIFVLMHMIANKENQGSGLEALIGVLFYGIFLVGSFIMTFKIVSAQSIAGFAEQAGMAGALVMAAPMTGASRFAQSMVHSPLKSLNKGKEGLSAFKGAMGKLSDGKIPHNGIADISKMSLPQMEKKLGAKSASGIYSANAKSAYHGPVNNDSGAISKQEGKSSQVNYSGASSSLSGGSSSGIASNLTSSSTPSMSHSNQAHEAVSTRPNNSIENFKNRHMTGVSNLGSQNAPAQMKRDDNLNPKESRTASASRSPVNRPSEKSSSYKIAHKKPSANQVSSWRS